MILTFLIYSVVINICFLSSPSDSLNRCDYGSYGPTSEYEDQNNIDFSQAATFAGGIANPMDFQVERFEVHFLFCSMIFSSFMVSVSPFSWCFAAGVFSWHSFCLSHLFSFLLPSLKLLLVPFSFLFLSFLSLVFLYKMYWFIFTVMVLLHCRQCTNFAWKWLN